MRNNLLLTILYLLLSTISFTLEAETRRSVPLGSYVEHIPKSGLNKSKVLVIAHGSLESGRSALQLATKFTQRWVGLAERYGYTLIVPAFDRDNYQSFGGYRGLFGRPRGADGFLHQILKKYIGKHDKFSLYGHSAGAQFAGRYLVWYPEKVKKVVLSAPGRYAFPNRAAPWPYGAGSLTRVIEYKNPREAIPVVIYPRFQSWIKATSVSTTVLVGSNDKEPQPSRPGHKGRDRVQLAKNWVKDMNTLAKQNGKKSQINLVIAGGIGHDSRALTPFAQDLIRAD